MVERMSFCFADEFWNEFYERKDARARAREVNYRRGYV